MTVKVVTDSVADLPSQVVSELGITVVPLMVRFGTKLYRDGVDLAADDFYDMLAHDNTLPVTSVPSPADFAQAYDRLAEETDQILAVTVSSRLSGTFEVARQSVGLMKRRCQVEVLDSQWATMALGFIVMQAARAACAGAGLDEVVAVARETISRVDFTAAFDTLEYLRRGGRIGRAQALLGSVLRIHPLITLREGVVEPAGRTHSRKQAIDRLYEFVRGFSEVEAMAVENTACPEDADGLAARLADLCPGKPIYHSRMTPAIGTHTGPGLLLVAVLGDKPQPQVA